MNGTRSVRALAADYHTGVGGISNHSGTTHSVCTAVATCSTHTADISEYTGFYTTSTIATTTSHIPAEAYTNANDTTFAAS